MLTIYRRHTKNCRQREAVEIRVHFDGDVFVRQGRRKCSCPIWVHGFFAGQKLRKPLHTRDWEKARNAILGWKPGADGNQSTKDQDRQTVATAWDGFLADVE